MKSDAEIRDDVINELHWDPQVTEPEAIGVAVKDGAVTLTGHVPGYAEKLAAARAAERVYGVKAVANDLKVQFSRAPRDDSDIATAIAHILEWNVQIPEGKVHARVENGWVTLAGEVDYDYQKREVERMVNHVRGVAGVQNFIIVRPPASPEAIGGDRAGGQARGRGGRAARQGRGDRPHHQALRARAFDAGGERRGGRGGRRSGDRRGGQPPGGNALAGRPSERAAAAAAGAGPGAAARSGGGAGTCVPACSPRART